MHFWRNVPVLLTKNAVDEKGPKIGQGHPPHFFENICVRDPSLTTKLKVGIFLCGKNWEGIIENLGDKFLVMNFLLCSPRTKISTFLLSSQHTLQHHSFFLLKKGLTLLKIYSPLQWHWRIWQNWCFWKRNYVLHLTTGNCNTSESNLKEITKLSLFT